MSEKYIRKMKNYCNIVKNSQILAKASNIDDAIFLRDLLLEHDWDAEEIPNVISRNDDYLVIAPIENKLRILARYRKKPDGKTVQKLIKKHSRNPNNSKYGLNITNYFGTFIIQKRIFGEEMIFGYYDNLKDAEFVRNFLLDNQWNVDKFKKIEFDEDTDTYKVIKVIDDTVYVLDTYQTLEEIDLKKTYEKFLSKIAKHKYGLVSYHHLDLLADKIDELECEFGVKPKDDTWSLNGKSALNDIIFNMTPFQKIIYDVISSKTTLDEIEAALVRYKTRNFKEKILKNLDELVELRLIEKIDDKTYKKTNL